MIPALRPDVESLATYLAPQVDAKVRLNTNECAFPLPEAFIRDLADAVTRIDFNRYPDRESTRLRAGLSELTGHPTEGIWVANGSNEVLQHLCLAFGGPGRAVLLLEPTYSMHRLIPRMVGTEIISTEIDEPWTLDERSVDFAAEPASMVIVCSPNNPTGNAQPLRAIAWVCEIAPSALVVVDEAYIEFGGESAQPLLARFDNLVVVRTFSKAFSLAAARIGYALASPALVEALPRVRLPYHLSALTQTAGEVALRHLEEARGVLDILRRQRERIVAELGDMEGVEVFPSDANFALFRTAADPDALWRALLDRDVLIRDVSAYPGLERCLRVSAGTPEETTAFLEALPPALEEVLG